MKQLDEIFYDAISSNSDLMDAIGGRVVSTCFEIPPNEEDNTQLPNIIITDDGFQSDITTKDDVWAGDNDRVQVTVDIAAGSPHDVKELVLAVRTAISNHIHDIYESGEEIPSLMSLTSEGIIWDWMKPCYFQRLAYQCDMNVEH